MWDQSPPQPSRSSKDLRQYRWHAYFLAKERIDMSSLSALPFNLSLSTAHCMSEQTKLNRVIAMQYPMLHPYRVPFASVAVRVAGSAVIEYTYFLEWINKIHSL
jgi:hypothetical protein